MAFDYTDPEWLKNNRSQGPSMNSGVGPSSDVTNAYIGSSTHQSLGSGENDPMAYHPLGAGEYNPFIYHPLTAGENNPMAYHPLNNPSPGVGPSSRVENKVAPPMNNSGIAVTSPLGERVAGNMSNVSGGVSPSINATNAMLSSSSDPNKKLLGRFGAY